MSSAWPVDGRHFRERRAELLKGRRRRQRIDSGKSRVRSDEILGRIVIAERGEDAANRLARILGVGDGR